MTSIEISISVAIAFIVVVIGVQMLKPHDDYTSIATNFSSKGRLIEEVKLKDGTRCVVLNQKIECDWRR